MSRQSVGHQVTDDTDTADRADGEPRQVQPVITGVVVQAGGGDHLRPGRQVALRILDRDDVGVLGEAEHRLVGDVHHRARGMS